MKLDSNCSRASPLAWFHFTEFQQFRLWSGAHVELPCVLLLFPEEASNPSLQTLANPGTGNLTSDFGRGSFCYKYIQISATSSSTSTSNSRSIISIMQQYIFASSIMSLFPLFKQIQFAMYSNIYLGNPEFFQDVSAHKNPSSSMSSFWKLNLRRELHFTLQMVENRDAILR